ncbi:hypothetical protein HDV05_006531, partial [Chytridiales sp. JEL 0842]
EEGEDWEDLDNDEVDELGGMFKEWGENDDDDDEVDEEEDDEDLKQDPVYNLNMTDFFVDFFKSCAACNLNGFEGLVEGYLDKGEKKVLRSILARP